MSGPPPINELFDAVEWLPAARAIRGVRETGGTPPGRFGDVAHDWVARPAGVKVDDHGGVNVHVAVKVTDHDKVNDHVHVHTAAESELRSGLR